MRRILATMTALALALGACGGDDDDGLAQTVTTTSTTSTTSATADEADDEPASTTTTAAPARERDLQAIILKLEDLPTGWTPSAAEEDADSGDEIDCFTEAAGVDFDNEADAEAQFQQGDFGPFVGASLIVAEDDGQASEWLAAFATGIQACDGYVQTDKDGGESTWTVAPLSFPDLGEGTFAARVTSTSDFGPLVLDMVVTQVDELLVYTVVFGIGGVDSALTEQVQRTQVDRA